LRRNGRETHLRLQAYLLEYRRRLVTKEPRRASGEAKRLQLEDSLEIARHSQAEVIIVD
jgi:hypothetical protein